MRGEVCQVLCCCSRLEGALSGKELPDGGKSTLKTSADTSTTQNVRESRDPLSFHASLKSVTKSAVKRATNPNLKPAAKLATKAVLKVDPKPTSTRLTVFPTRNE